MCTVSWLRRAFGYVLLCNRDERHTRKPAGEPQIGEARGVSFLAPIDGDHGGSWIGVNQFGLTLCLLNRYDDLSADPKRNYTSRGLLLTDLLDCRDGSQIGKRLADTRLDRFRPFTLLALSVDAPAMLVGWNGRECAIQLDAEVHSPLTSSSFRNPNVPALRRQLFVEMVSQQGIIDADLLHRFHRSHLPDRGPYSVCMHRDDAATVSLSTIRVTRNTIEFIYHPGAPCVAAADQKVRLDRYAAHSRVAAL